MIAIDISYWQHSPDFAKVRAAGVGLVIMKMGGAEPGHLYFDSVYKANRAAARAVGLAVGSYFFNGAVNPTDAANFQMNNVDWKPGDVVALDVENATNVARWNPTQVLEWCKAIMARGVPANRILVYMSSSVTRAANWSAVAALGVGLWVAQYGTNNGSPQGSPSIAYWSSWALWQYTSTKTWPGIVGNVDTNQVAAAWAAGTLIPIDISKEVAMSYSFVSFPDTSLVVVVSLETGNYIGIKSQYHMQLLQRVQKNDGSDKMLTAELDVVKGYLTAINPPAPAVDLSPVLKAIANIPAASGGGTVDLSAVLEALAALKVPTAAENGAAARAAIVK